MQRNSQQRVSLHSFSLFKSLPTAEKWGLGGAVIATAFAYCTGYYSVSFMLAAVHYMFHKYEQDKAVASYYDEIKWVQHDTYKLHNIYRNSLNVEAMGGSDAIENACATRVFGRF
jgi:hypothetical protein